MRWIVDVDGDAGSRAAAHRLHRAEPGLQIVDVPVGGLGIVLCSTTSPRLVEVVEDLTERRGRAVVVVCSDAEFDPWPLLAAGVEDVLVWDGDPEPVLARLARLREIDATVRSDVVTQVLRGSSAALRESLRDLVTAARYGSGPVLVLGETGTGKELAARVVHRLTPATAGGNLVVVDCTTIVASLSGSELFGHERGAFTGAVSVRTGACAAANGGTLMLDEVGELPLDLQPELLRVVQEGTYKRVGSDTWQRARFRLVCATHRELDAEVAAGRFRADLYYRIAASVVRLPPLRDRIEDIVPLFATFVAEAAGRAEPVEITPSVQRILRRRRYPGNLRDLRQLAQRVASRHVGSGPVTPGDLAPGDRPAPQRSTGDLPADDVAAVGASLTVAVREQLAAGTSLRELREGVADLAVRLTLAECGGNVKAAAARLGVTDRALHLRRAQSRDNSDASSANKGSRSSRESSE